MRSFVACFRTLPHKLQSKLLIYHQDVARELIMTKYLNGSQNAVNKLALVIPQYFIQEIGYKRCAR
ncbi:CLUMA_CG013769, isoform A [Clunio marinus]|uniref:CLUMA_CG013769, isoform A n=1 Tax=Clunio marinus TaxID=568069 RepID=A0A1J1ILR7_9DIPT|nr:CLUMA_CG013769, isoform A [Clunio marinus]